MSDAQRASAYLEHLIPRPDPCDVENLERLIVEVRAEERAAIVAWLREWAEEAEGIPGPPQYEDALRNAAEAIEAGDHQTSGNEPSRLVPASGGAESQGRIPPGSNAGREGVTAGETALNGSDPK